MTIVKLTDKEDPMSSRQCSLFEEITIGRIEGDIICEDNPCMHSRHCMIKALHGAYFLYDMPLGKVRNHTVVNGKEIEEDFLCQLVSGDEIAIGRKTYIIEFYCIKDIPFIETAIKMYKANKDNDMVVYMVFSALATEQIYLPMNDDGNLLTLTIEDNEDIIPIFSKRENLGDNEPVNLHPCYMKDCLGILLRAGKNMIINPLCDEEIQFVLPYEALELMLMPVMEQEELKNQ